jgi:DMSO/TMAO reductase YedYZ molybdopterin-dependent catalytic subunit
MTNRNERVSRRLWASGLVGAASACTMLGGWLLLYGLRIGPFPPLDLADLVIRYAPGGVATWAIETLEHRSQPIIVMSVVLAFIGFWSMGGMLIQRRPSLSSGIAFGFLQAPVVIAMVHASEERGVAGLIWAALVLGGTLAAAGAAAGRWIQRLSKDSDERERTSAASTDWMTQMGTSTRRDLLRGILLTTTILGGGGSLLGILLRRAGVNEPSTAENMPLEDVRSRATSIGLPNLTTPGPVARAGPLVEQMSFPSDVRSRITSNREFYVVDISIRKPVIPESDWRLRVHGLVNRELSITYADLLAEPAVEIHGTLMCISYTHDNDLMSSTLWTGVPLYRVLERAGVMDGVVDLICRGPGGYSDSIRLDDALARNTILAYGMNGVTLPREHGFPCRLYVPGLYGEKNVKWLEEIELVDYDYKGYWQERGWTDIAHINTMSAIDTSRGTSRGSHQAGVPVGGIAFAGTRGIRTVDVRVDDGDWQRAEVESYDPDLLWQRWRFEWQPARGPHTLTVRCVDGDGVTQTSEERTPHPDGMTGHHTIEVVVV